MRVLPPVAQEEPAPRKIFKDKSDGDMRDMRIEPGFPMPPMVENFQRRSAPIADFRSRPSGLKVVRDMRDSAPEN
jgi:hypothetical protein